MPGRLYVGASSWVDKSLVASGRFYPGEVKDTPARLAYYAERFNLAEVDSTYYALPSRHNIERWAQSVPDGFRFVVKAFSLFTQHPTRLSSIPKSFHESSASTSRPASRAASRRWWRSRRAWPPSASEAGTPSAGRTRAPAPMSG